MAEAVAIGTIEEIIDNSVTIRLAININEQPNLVNLHVIFEDGTNRKVVAEIANVNQTRMIANIVGEINNGVFIPGSSSKPSFKSRVRIINLEELELLFGKQETSFGETNFGISNIYNGYRINVSINDFFSNHFAILGNTGSGKSCTLASIIQTHQVQQYLLTLHYFSLMLMVNILRPLVDYMLKIQIYITKLIQLIWLILILKY